MPKLRPDLLLDALRRHAAEQGLSERAANDALAEIQNVARGRAQAPVSIDQLMRKETA